jgi:DNA invertase Pin-like site-specific DNA recombinase
MSGNKNSNTSNKNIPRVRRDRISRAARNSAARRNNSDTANITLQVPANMVGQLQEFLQNLQLGTSMVVDTSVESDEEYVDEYVEAEVKSVIGHRVLQGGRWEFNINFGRGYTEWVPDDECSCEEKITAYLNAEAPEVKTIHIVCRVSTKSQTSCTSTSLEGQEAEIKDGISGEWSTDPNRSSYNTRLRVHKISNSAYKGIPKTMRNIGHTVRRGDEIIVWRADRLSRNIVLFMQWLEDLRKRGIEIKSQVEKLSYSKQRLEFIQKIVDAQKEAEALSQRIKLSYKQKRERGDERIGGLPYGYKYHRLMNSRGKVVRKAVVAHRNEQSLLARIFASKDSASEIAEQLNSGGIFKRGRKWNRAMILRIRKSYKKANNPGRKNGWEFVKK